MPEPLQASQHSLVEAQPAQQQLLTRETVTGLLNDRRAVQLARTGAGWTIWLSRHDGSNRSSSVCDLVMSTPPACITWRRRLQHAKETQVQSIRAALVEVS